MRGREKDSTNPPTPPPALPEVLLPEPDGPSDDRFVYHLTLEAERLLEEHQARAGGQRLYYRSSQPPKAANDDQPEDPREERRRLARDARRRGRRFGTISRRYAGGEARPFLRLSGRWLREAGFDLGQHFEVEVEEGQLVIETV